jgi:hypothetical protein
MGRPGRPENLKRGRDREDPPTRKVSDQKATDFCIYLLTHGESIKAAALHMNIAPTYAYEFFNKPVVQAKLKELRAALGDAVLQSAATQMIGSLQFIDEHLAPIVANPQPHPTRGYSDQIAAARLLVELLYSLTPKGRPHVGPACVVASQPDQTDTRRLRCLYPRKRQEKAANP